MRTKTMLSILMTILATSVLLGDEGRIQINHALAIAGGVVPGDNPGYPVYLGTEPNSFVLTGNLTPPDSQSGITNGSGSDGGVYIDLNGFSITHDDGASNVWGIRLFGSGNTVVNGTVSGAGSLCVGIGQDARVEGILASNCRQGINTSINSVIRGNRVENADEIGISSLSSTLVGNAVRDSGTWDIECTGCARDGNVCSDSSCSPNRRFYLTKTGWQGGGATNFCAQGFHMASTWELADKTLRYDSTLGDSSRADMGQGAPTILFGWVRTGYIALGSSSGTGLNNCNAWTTSLSSLSGTAVSLGAIQPGGATDGPPWVAANWQCNTTLQVWCVEN